jgi:hypothetical protein
MLPLACAQHWYESAIFFGPIFIVGFWVWFSGRRQAAAGSGEDRDRAIGPPSPDSAR